MDARNPAAPGSACWLGCNRAIPPKSYMEWFDVPPVPVKPESSIFIKYPEGYEPDILNATIAIKNDVEYDLEAEPLKFDGRQLTVPKEAGTYMIWIKSIWHPGADTSYFFVIEVTE